jgi:hypothetical protein
MLTIPELTDARDKLRQADILIAVVRGMFITGGDVRGARIMNDIIGLIADEIAALDKAIGGGQP